MSSVGKASKVRFDILCDIIIGKTRSLPTVRRLLCRSGGHCSPASNDWMVIGWSIGTSNNIYYM